MTSKNILQEGIYLATVGHAQAQSRESLGAPIRLEHFPALNLSKLQEQGAVKQRKLLTRMEEAAWMKFDAVQLKLKLGGHQCAQNMIQ